MSEYQFYLLNEDDRDVARENHFCADDESAIQRARSLCWENKIDIWSQARRVARIGQPQVASGRAR